MIPLKNKTSDTSESSKKPRKPRSTAPDGQSKAFDALQDFEQAIWETKLKPSMNEFNGQVADVWDVDQGSDRLFLNELRHTFKMLVPREKYYTIQPSMTASKIVSLLSIAYVRLTSLPRRSMPTIGPSRLCRLAFVLWQVSYQAHRAYTEGQILSNGGEEEYSGSAPSTQEQDP